MINVIKGNLLDSNCDYICHQVNCQGKMNSGIAKQIREKWPVVYNNYMSKCDTISDLTIKTNDILLGSIQIVGLWEDYYSADFHQSVINMFSQEYYGYDGRRYTSYDAFWNCLNLIKQTVPKGRSIAFPYNIGCCRGGANWEVIYAMIVAVLNEDYDIYFYELEE